MPLIQASATIPVIKLLASGLVMPEPVSFCFYAILLLLVLESGWVKSGNVLVGMISLEFWTESPR